MNPEIIPLLAFVGVAASFYLLVRGRRKDAGEIRAFIDDGALVVDVRSPGEFAGGHAPGAVNIPVDLLADEAANLPASDRPVVVYCASGMRSARAASILRKRGYRVMDAGTMANLPAGDG